ncbi:o-succinylbenzoate--CoA ligase [Demetria terragena]|uniref:o-succinylbenzoate--CoA ligase n=1 Tax=Demetria terragena TaxID=63959 RepID=UPI0003787CC4
MPELLPVAVDPARLPVFLEALTAMLEGSGPALLPYAAGTPEPSTPSGPFPDDLGIVASTSGSTGPPKRAALTRANLIASAAATHERLGGPGQWLLALPAHHIAGMQVLLRSLLARQAPILLNLDQGFDPADIGDALAWAPPGRHYTSLVPVQLQRVLDHAEGARALRTFDAVLIGGASCPPALLAHARSEAINVVTTYGMSETAGGCVYDGKPLNGTEVHFDDDGRIGLSGPMVAAGYLSQGPANSVFDTAPSGERRFWTDDLGAFENGALRVLGRRDDLIITGGLKVAPRLVEEAALALPGVDDAVAVATPSDKWGQAVSLAVASDHSLSIAAIREDLRGSLPAHALPTRLIVLSSLPTRGPGKPDRAAIASMDEWQNWSTPRGFTRRSACPE